MMKKAIKKLLAALLAVAMVCAMAIPAFAENSEGDVDSHHTYSAFQIFKGDVEGNNIKDFKISNVDWGSNIINNSDDFLNKLREADHIGPLFTNAKSAQEVLAVISQWHDSDDYSIAFARFVCHYLYSNDANPTYVVRAGSNALTIPEAKAGYYLFVDTTDFSKDDSYHSYNSFLLMVTKGNWNVPITPKAEKPTVEKKVYDNPDGTSTGGFGSSADHAINEKFQFQLTATLPDSTNRAYDYYDKYSVIFHDTLSEGITYDKDDELDSVVIKSNGNTYNITDSSKYTIDTTDLESQNSFVVNIDVKACAKDAGFDLNNGATITVTYTAHLNDKAYVNTAGGSTSNINKVYLSAILDLYDRRIVSYVIRDKNNNALVFDTVDNALLRNPGAQPLFHSDRGFQYTNRTFHIKLVNAGITQSMSRVAKCIDNGPMEGFWGILKRERYYGKRFTDRDTLEKMIEDYIDYYNNKRLQRNLGILTPMEKHEIYLQAA